MTTHIYDWFGDMELACAHNWVDITALNAPEMSFICARCGALKHEPFPEFDWTLPDE